MFKIDTHVHTSEVSPCGQVGAEELVSLYKEAGYDAIVITDHYYEGFLNNYEDLGWNNKVDMYIKGYKVAEKAGKRVGLYVFLGMEIRFKENPNDYVIYGVTEEFLRGNAYLYELGLAEFRKLADKNGLLIYQAHPFRNGITAADPRLLDGVEVFNGNPRHDSHNDLALKFAKDNVLRMSSGSDFHQVADCSRGGMIFDEEYKTNEEFVKALVSSMESKYEIMSC